MADFAQFQREFINEIKKKLPPNYSLVHELAETLDISIDSAYRRMRAQTTFSFKEVQLLSGKFNISVDDLLGGETDKVSFSYKPIDEKGYNFSQFLESLRNDLNGIYSLQDRELICTTNEMSIFHVLQIPEITAFKTYFWTKVTLGYESMQVEKFDLQKQMNEYRQIADELSKLYTLTPSIDIISESLLDHTLQQLAYFLEKGFFKSVDEALLICDKLLELVNHLEKESEAGKKFRYGGEPKSLKENYKLYISEAIIPDNIMLIRKNDQYTEYITVNALNFIQTNDQGFCKDTMDFVENLTRKSNLINTYTKKGRNKFFLKIRNKVNLFVERIT